MVSGKKMREALVGWTVLGLRQTVHYRSYLLERGSVVKEVREYKNKVVQYEHLGD